MDLDLRFKDTIYLVEANSCEGVYLWKEFHTQFYWEQDCSGKIIQIGELDNRPVNIEISWSKINRYRVAFWDACSQVVDYKMINDWFLDNLPDVHRTDAMNFHQVIHAIYPAGWPYGPVIDEDLKELIIRSEKTKNIYVASILKNLSKILPKSRS